MEISGGGGGGGAPTETLQMATIPTVSLQDGDSISFRINVPSGNTINVYSIGVQNNSNNAPANLDAVVRDETNATTMYTSNQKREVGDPLVSKDGDIDVAFRIENDTGGVENATATFAYEIQ